MPYANIRNAIARIEIANGDTTTRRGSGCLVGTNLILTALHVVADRSTDPPEFFPGNVEVRFPDVPAAKATVLEGRWDAVEDWALLTCDPSPPDIIRPLRMATLDRDGDEWTAYGFPDAERRGLTVHGIVINSAADLFGGRAPAYQLYCREAAAGRGLRVKGLSGAPVIVRDAVVGIIRSAPLEDDRAEAGTLFACPVSLVAVRCNKYFSEPLPGISSTSVNVAAPASHPPAPVQMRREIHPIVLTLLPTIVAIVLIGILALWRVPTYVRLILPVQRATFTLAASDPPLVRITDAVPVSAVTAERFRDAALETSAVEIADPSQYRLAEDLYPEAAWRAVDSRGTLQFDALDDSRLPSLTIERAAGGEPLTTIGPMTVPAPSGVAVETSGRSVTFTLSHERPALTVPIHGRIRLTAAYATARSLGDPLVSDPSSTWRIVPRNGVASVTIRGKPGVLVTSVAVPSDGRRTPLSLFSDGAIAVSAIDFSRQDEFGHRVSSVVADGELVYLDGPNNERRAIEPLTVVQLDRLQSFHIRSLAMNPDGRSLRLEVEGRAGTVITERGSQRTDHRLTAISVIRRGTAPTIAGLTLWLLASLAAGVRSLDRRNAFTRSAS